MKQWILTVLVLLVFYANACCDEITYVVTQDSHLEHPGQRHVRTATVRKGETVSFRNEMGRGRIYPFPRFEPSIRVRTEQGHEGFIDARHILLRGDMPLPSAITERYWIYSFYQRFAFEGEKEALFYHEPFWRDDYDDIHSGIPTELIAPWWIYVNPTTFFIRDNFRLPAGRSPLLAAWCCLRSGENLI